MSRRVQEFRRLLHRHPDPSNREHSTAARVEAFLRRFGLAPARRHVGGHGLLYVIEGRLPGPRTLFRAELDALPIQERTQAPHRSRRAGVHHACGHDGHMAMLAGALVHLHKSRSFAGTIYAAFQPAEEVGEGAARFLADWPRAPALDRVYAIHNVPGLPVGSIGIRRGTAARASVGVTINVEGRRSHASEPDLGVNPLPVLARIAQSLQPKATVRSRFATPTLATLVGWASEGPNFGVSPGAGSLSATMRADTVPQLERFLATVERTARRIATPRLQVSLRRQDVFPETRNDTEAAKHVVRAARRARLEVRWQNHPLSASEDFGHFTKRWPGALVLLGAGIDQPSLHADTYDFPDRALAHGLRLWLELAGFRGVDKHGTRAGRA